MRRVLELSVALLLAAPLVGAPGEGGANVVVLLVDDLGYADLSVQGSKLVRTPRIDSLANAGVRFTQAFATSSVCSPSRAGLLTGRYQQRFGHEFNVPRKYSTKDGLPAGEATLGDALRAAGHRTLYVGKWHLGFTASYHPVNRGFDSFYGFLQGARSYLPMPEQRLTRMNRMLRDLEPAPEDFEYLTDRFGTEAVAYLDAHQAQHADRRFFLLLSFSAVHIPLQAPDDLLTAFEDVEDEERRTALAMTAALDRAVGLVLDALERHELEDETLVLLVNDNGGAENNAADNTPLRGFKGSPFDGGLRVPMLARWPGVLPAGVVYDELVSTLDVFPTVVAAARGAAPEDPEGSEGPEDSAELDGVDLVPYVNGERKGAPHDALFWRRGDDWAVRQGDWKLVGAAGEDVALFRIGHDPGEAHDLARANPEVAERLAALHAAWASELIEPQWRGWVGDESDR